MFGVGMRRRRATRSSSFEERSEGERDMDLSNQCGQGAADIQGY
jgi:hypothetical protein